jgi:hypothetical protein
MACNSYTTAMGFIVGGKATGQQEHREVFTTFRFPDALTELEAVHVGHGRIGQYHLGPLGLERGQSFAGVMGDEHLKIRLGKRRLHHFLDGKAVLNQ